MVYETPLEARVASLVSAYADLAPTSVDALAVAHSAAADGDRSVEIRWTSLTVDRGMAFALLILTLLVTMVAAMLASGGHPLRRDADERLTARRIVQPFLGLPPDDAAPSTPEEGELVLSFVGRVYSLGLDVHAMWLFDDGRLIWRRNLDASSDPSAFGSVGRTKAVLEQRLTPDGVERLRSTVLRQRSGAARPVVAAGVLWGELWIRDGDRLVGGSLSDPLLPGRLADPGSWLPATAWADRETRPYVPTRYGVCLPGGDLDVLPDAVQTAIRSRASGMASSSTEPHCWVLATAVAQEVAASLERVGNEPVLTYSGLYFQTPGGVDPSRPTRVDFVPLTPDGAPICLWCG